MTLDKSDILYKTLYDFYKVKKNFATLIRILGGYKGSKQKKIVSLRIIEWFCYKYAEKYNVCYELNGKQFNVYQSYRNQLKSYKKEYLDPFKRKKTRTRKKILALSNNSQQLTETDFEFTMHNKTILTTLAQLNFFRWIIKNNILEYILANVNKIRDDMNSHRTTKIHKTSNIKTKSLPPNIKKTTIIKTNKKVSIKI